MMWDGNWLQNRGIKTEKVMIGMIHLLDLTYRDIGNRREVPANRKLNRQIFDYLFKERHLANFISSANEESITRIYTLVEDVKELDPSSQDPCSTAYQGEVSGVSIWR